MKRTTKRYVITTGAVNCYGYRILTDGVDYTQYQNNPVLLWMHIRADGNNKNQILPLGRMVEIRREGDALTGQPEFDENDSFAMSVFNKYENGTLNMLSLGAKSVETSEDPQYMLPGQTNPTVIRCKVTDISAVDIGGNDQAKAVQLYDANGREIALSQGSITSFLQLAKKGDQLANSNPQHKQSTIDIVTNAVNAGKITPGGAATLMSAGTDEKSVNGIKEFVKRSKIDPDKLEGKIPKAIADLATMTWHELKKKVPGDGTKTLKEHAPEIYKAKHFEEYDRMPSVVNGRLL